MLAPGSVVGRYTIIRLLGVGGMAEVYEALESELNRGVALKVVSSSNNRDEEAVPRFNREVLSAAKLNHRSIVPIYSFGHDRQQELLYYSMRLLPGGDLCKRIAAGNLTVREALRILRELAKAFAHAHSRQVVHRDVKPANILFDDENFPVLTDFGIAKALDASGKLTKDGHAIGTALYMSPEQACGDDVDARTDLYGLGVILFEMLTGRPPYQGDARDVLFKHIGQPVPKLPQEFAPLQSLITTLMAKAPADRPRNAEALIELIDQVSGGASEVWGQASAPIEAPSPLLDRMVTPQQSSETVLAPSASVRRKWVPRVVVATVGALVIAGASGAWWMQERAAEQERIRTEQVAEQQRLNKKADADRLALEQARIKEEQRIQAERATEKETQRLAAEALIKSQQEGDRKRIAVDQKKKDDDAALAKIAADKEAKETADNQARLLKEKEDAAALALRKDEEADRKRQAEADQKKTDEQARIKQDEEDAKQAADKLKKDKLEAEKIRLKSLTDGPTG